MNKEELVVRLNEEIVRLVDFLAEHESESPLSGEPLVFDSFIAAAVQIEARYLIRGEIPEARFVVETLIQSDQHKPEFIRRKRYERE